MSPRPFPTEEFSAVCDSREAAHRAAEQAYAHAQAMLANGERPRIVCTLAVEPVSIRLRRFFHGVVLKQVSEQARVMGDRFTIDVWKEHVRRLFVGDHGFRWETMRLPGTKHATPRRVRISTEELGNREYAKLVDEVIQYATVELGVEFIFTHEDQVLLTRKPTRREHADDRRSAADDGA